MDANFIKGYAINNQLNKINKLLKINSRNIMKKLMDF